jgi:hypothetical protein
LARLDICPFTDAEWEALPHVFLTAETEWDPSTLDHEFAHDAQWSDPPSDLSADPSLSVFDETGAYRNRIVVNATNHHPISSLDDLVDDCALYHHHDKQPLVYDAHAHHGSSDSGQPILVSPPATVVKRPPDYTKLRPLFGWLSSDISAKTYHPVCLPSYWDLIETYLQVP